MQFFWWGVCCDSCTWCFIARTYKHCHQVWVAGDPLVLPDEPVNLVIYGVEDFVLLPHPATPGKFVCICRCSTVKGLECVALQLDGAQRPVDGGIVLSQPWHAEQHIILQTWQDVKILRVAQAWRPPWLGHECQRCLIQHSAAGQTVTISKNDWKSICLFLEARCLYHHAAEFSTYKVSRTARVQHCRCWIAIDIDVKEHRPSRRARPLCVAAAGARVCLRDDAANRTALPVIARQSGAAGGFGGLSAVLTLPDVQRRVISSCCSGTCSVQVTIRRTNASGTAPDGISAGNVSRQWGEVPHGNVGVHQSASRAQVSTGSAASCGRALAEGKRRLGLSGAVLPA